jgi:hypothetical protein
MLHLRRRAVAANIGNNCGSFCGEILRSKPPLDGVITICPMTVPINVPLKAPAALGGHVRTLRQVGLGYVRFRHWTRQGVWDTLLQTPVDLELTDD